MLHHNDPERALRLAWLIADRAPELNAAMFAAPEKSCAPELVEPRFCALPAPVMRQLHARAAKGVPGRRRGGQGGLGPSGGLTTGSRGTAHSPRRPRPAAGRTR